MFSKLLKNQRFFLRSSALVSRKRLNLIAKLLRILSNSKQQVEIQFDGSHIDMFMCLRIYQLLPCPSTGLKIFCTSANV